MWQARRTLYSLFWMAAAALVLVAATGSGQADWSYRERRATVAGSSSRSASAIAVASDEDGHSRRRARRPPSLLKHVTLVVVASKGSQEHLRAAQCTYMAVLNPAQIVHVTDYALSSVGGCGLPLLSTLRVPCAVDYTIVLRTLYSSTIELLSWTLIGEECAPPFPPPLPEGLLPEMRVATRSGSLFFPVL